MIRWGVIGPGGIAGRFAEAMRLVDSGRIVGVASRSAERAATYAERFEVERTFTTSEALVASPDVDAIYVATPHSCHEHDTLVALEAGKHVLCEKPFALNARQAERMIAAASERGLFLMEAVWTRFLPSYVRLREVVASGRIGDPQLVEADFGFRSPVMPEHRLFDPALGGGAMLDLGIYPLQLATMVLGPPGKVAADGVVGTTGVDEIVAALVHHRGGGLSVVKAALRANLACTARITGTEGVIDLPAFMHCPDALVVTAGGTSDRIDAGFQGDGLRFQIDEVHRCLAQGRTQSLIMPLDETLVLARTLDEIRAAVGVVYPGDAE